MGRALNYENASPEGVFNELLDSLLVLNSNENGMIVSSGLHNGNCIRGVIADEVHVPSLDLSNTINDLSLETMVSTVGKNDYELLRSTIKNVLPVARRDADTSAYEIWLESMKGSLSAGFEVAMNAGPICEEPVSRLYLIFARNNMIHNFTSSYYILF